MRVLTIGAVLLSLFALSIGCASRNPYVTGGIIDMQQSRFASAEEQFKKAIELEPNNSDAHMWLGKSYASQKKYVEAAGEFDEALSINPAHKSDIESEDYFYWAVYYNAGLALTDQSEWEPAENNLKRAIDVLPDSISPYNQLSYVYTRQEKNAEAEEILKMAAERAPNDMAIRVSLARLKIRDQDYDEAKTLLEEATTKDPENAQAHYYLGLVLSNMRSGGSSDSIYARRSEEAFAMAASLDSTDKDAWFNLAFTRMSRKKYPEAVEGFNKAVKLAEDDEEAWLYLGMCYYQVGNYDMAIEAFDKTIVLDPKSGDAYIQRGYAKQKKGLKNEAYEDIQYGNKLNKE